MLGRSIGLTYEKLRHLGDDPLPHGVYSPAEAAVIKYAQRSTRGLAIDASTYRALAEHFSAPQIIDICLNVGLSQITNRFNATFLPDVDEIFMTSNQAAYANMAGPPLEYPPKPGE
jgi:alkylhydroperoxidase family enzyme